MTDATNWLMVMALGVLVMLLLELRRAERAVQAQAAAQRIGNDLAKRQALIEQGRRLQEVRNTFGTRHGHHGHHHHHGHAGGNASIPGGCD